MESPQARGELTLAFLPLVVALAVFGVGVLWRFFSLIAPDPHVFIRFRDVAGPPAVVAAFVMFWMIIALDHHVYPPGVPVGRRAWIARLTSPGIVLIAFVAYREIDFQVARFTATMPEPVSDGIIFRMADSWRGRRTLRRIMRDSKKPVENRVRAARALRPDGAPVEELNAFVSELAHHPDAEVRMKAAGLLSLLPADEAVRIGIALAADSDWRVRDEALIRAPGTPDVGVLLQYLDDDDARLRHWALTHYIRHPTSFDAKRPVLLRLLESPHPEQRFEAARALIRRRDSTAYAMVVAALRDGLREKPGVEFDVVHAAIGALGEDLDNAAPILWTISECPTVADRYRLYARESIQMISVRRYGLVGRIPPEYQEVPQAEAPRKAAWRSEFCPAAAKK